MTAQNGEASSRFKLDVFSGEFSAALH